MMAFLEKVGEFLAGGTAQSVYWAFAISGTILFILSVALSMFGASSDLADADMDMDGEIDLPHPDTGFLDLKFLSFRTILAFLTMFGWGGVVFGDHGWAGFAGALACGLVTMVLTAYLIMSILKLQQDGTRANASLVGKKGTVYLAIPAGGRGKVVLDLGDSTREVTASSEVALAKGDPVVTTGLHAEVFTVKPV